MRSLKTKVYMIFSDTLMIALALLIIPVIIVQNFFQLTPMQMALISVADWLIWIAFFLEFSLKLVVEEKRLKWLLDNKLDSTVSLIVIISPILEHLSSSLTAAPLLRLLRLGRITRLTRLTRLIRLIRLAALGTRIKKSWRNINLKAYAAFFLIIGVGFTASFIATGFEHAPVDITWISLFVSIFGVFYAVLISFFVIHIWAKFNAIGGEISREVNSLRNVYILTKQLLGESIAEKFSDDLIDYIDEVVKRLWAREIVSDFINKKFFKLIGIFKSLNIKEDSKLVIFDNIIEEMRTSSVAQANVVNLARDKTPKILWILLILLSSVLVGSFVFLGFKNQLLATILITLVSGVTALIVALIFDIDTPFKAGFWNISPEPYLDLKKFIGEK